MTPVTSLILILLAIVLSVVFGRKHANMGLIALGLAYLLGCFVLGFRANALYALFPAKVILQFIFISYFYGILIENGTIQWIAEKASYYARNTSFLIPIIIFVLCLLLSIAGVPPVSGCHRHNDTYHLLPGWCPGILNGATLSRPAGSPAPKGQIAQDEDDGVH